MKRINQLAGLGSDVVYDRMVSPVGCLTLFVSKRGLHTILWENEADSGECRALLARFQLASAHPLILQTKQQLNEYFVGKRKSFDLPLKPIGSVFQQQAWRALQMIPYGQTRSYGEQAAGLGDKSKARAVGMANALNPISIIIPCHRVIGSNGKLTGFAGGLKTKRFLLALEQTVS